MSWNLSTKKTYENVSLCYRINRGNYFLISAWHLSR